MCCFQSRRLTAATALSSPRCWAGSSAHRASEAARTLSIAAAQSSERLRTRQLCMVEAAAAFEAAQRMAAAAAASAGLGGLEGCLLETEADAMCHRS
eukprot:COSAG01_NODE_30974_length_606_cov_0.814596_1_plen_97_part_00